MEKQKNSRGVIIAVVVFCLLVAGFIIAWQMLKPQGTQGAKTIQAEILAEGKDPVTYSIETDAEFLRQALDEKDLIQGDESAYGFFVKIVDGITADDGNLEWWCITKGGEQLTTGVDDTPIVDGDHFEITLMVGYDSYE